MWQRAILLLRHQTSCVSCFVLGLNLFWAVAMFYSSFPHTALFIMHTLQAPACNHVFVNKNNSCCMSGFFHRWYRIKFDATTQRNACAVVLLPYNSFHKLFASVLTTKVLTFWLNLLFSLAEVWPGKEYGCACKHSQNTELTVELEKQGWKRTETEENRVGEDWWYIPQ